MDRRRRTHQKPSSNPFGPSSSDTRSPSSSWNSDSNPSNSRCAASRGRFTKRHVNLRGRASGGDRRREQEHEDEGGRAAARIDRDRQSSLVGTCAYMCPVGEMDRRERLRDLAVFERLHDNPVKTSSALAVKKFCRTISTKNVQLSDIRPLPVLERTLDYLMSLMETRDEPFELVHDFIFDRSRSIRQDMSMQNIVNWKAIQMYEKMAKFHVISHHKLRIGSHESDNTIISSWHHLNMEQLAKVLTSLYNLYEVNQLPNTMHKNEAEFRSLYVLLCLNSESLPEGETLSLWLRQVPSLVIKSKEMFFARRVLRYFRTGNYKRFFDIVAAEASYLQYCVIEPSLDKVRALAVSCINAGGYKLHPYPIAHLSTLLRMQESEMEAFCKACNLETSLDQHGNKMLPTKQATFTHPKRGFEKYSFIGLERFNRQ